MSEVIEQTIEIAATPAHVWKLVSEPGWWINDGEYVAHEIAHRDGLVFVTDPTHGEFALVPVDADPPRYVSFRWLARQADPQPDSPGTLTEFWIEERPGGVLLRVRESGFETLGVSASEQARKIADNTSGWEKELDVARRHVET